MEFFKHLNSIVHDRHPHVLMIAEESTSFPGISHPLAHGGLGFDFKWNMGWMNDSLRYFSKDTLYRHHHHNDLTFGLLYAFSESFILPFSHDEVVHKKNSLLGRMPGDMWQQFANMRLLYSYMICQPGKKLLFMGGEIGQWNEWNCKGEIEWSLLQYPTHHALQTMVRELNHFYLAHAPLWERDTDHTGFEWVDFADRQNSVICYLRKGSQGALLCVHNCTPVYYQRYMIRLANVSFVAQIFNTDDTRFGGSGKVHMAPEILNDGTTPYALQIELAPLATMIYQVEFL
jgi:1,4-alpha-glucan branching enzyme